MSGQMIQMPLLKLVDSVIFDLDGTLWDACPTCAVGWNRSLANHRISLASVSSSIGTEPSECQDWRVELQSYVDRGTLTCAEAEKILPRSWLLWLRGL